MKKNLVIFALSLLLTACGTTNPFTFENYNIDLKPVEKQGIFITTGDIANKEYKTAGFVVSNCYPGYVIKYKTPKSDKNPSIDDVYSSTGESIPMGSNFEDCSYKEMLDALVAKTKELNANAIINLKVLQISRPATDGKSLQLGVQIQGLAVQLIN